MLSLALPSAEIEQAANLTVGGAHQRNRAGSRLARMLRAVSLVGYPLLVGMWGKHHLGPIYRFSGAGPRNPSIDAIALAHACLLIPLLTVPLRSRRPSASMYWCFYAVGIVPGSMLTLYTGEQSHQTVFAMTVFIPALYAILGQYCRLTPEPPPAIVQAPPPKRVRVIAVVCMIICVATIGLLVVLNPGAFTTWLKLDDVYARRSDYKNIGNQIPGLFYLLPWVSSVLNPFLVVVGRMYRWSDMFAVGILGHVILFLFTGERAIPFRLAVVLVWLYLSARRQRLDAAGWATTGLFGLLGSSWIIDAIFGFPNPVAIMMIRLLATPQQVAVRFFQFFSNHGYAYFSDGVPGKIFGYRRYALELPNLIGKLYFGGANANTGIFSDGFANLGLLGIVLVGLFLVLQLVVMDRAYAVLPLWFSSPLLALRALDLTNGATITVFVSGGIGLSMLLLALCRPRGFANPGWSVQNRGQHTHRRARDFVRPPNAVTPPDSIDERALVGVKRGTGNTVPGPVTPQ